MTKNHILTAAVLSVGALTSFGSMAKADRNDRQDVKEARKEVKKARKDVREERREVRNANNPQDRREERRDVKEAREDLRDARGDLRDEKRENNNGAIVYRNGRYYRNSQIFTGTVGGFRYNNGYRTGVNNGAVYNNGNVYYRDGRYYRNGQIFSGNNGGNVYNNGYRGNVYNNAHNNQFSTIQGVVTSYITDNAINVRLNNGSNVRVQLRGQGDDNLNRGDVVRVYGSTQNGVFRAQNITIVRNG